MAFIFKSNSISLVLAAMLVLALTATRIEGSTLTVFQGPGCTGDVQVLSCGQCQELQYTGGYYFLYTSGYAVLYESASCTGSPGEVLTDDSWHCSYFDWKSVFISCSA